MLLEISLFCPNRFLLMYSRILFLVLTSHSHPRESSSGYRLEWEGKQKCTAAGGLVTFTWILLSPMLTPDLPLQRPPLDVDDGRLDASRLIGQI